jgi:acyl-CoA thioesterase
MGSRFADDTTVTRADESRYEATIPDAWNLRPLPHGGYVTALALRAMSDRLDHPEQRLRTLHTAFVAQVAAGPVTIGVELLRAGRSMSHLRAEVTNVGAERGHVTTAVFGAPRDGFAYTDLDVPRDVPPPHECPSFRDPPPPGVEFFDPMPFWAQIVEGRAAIGHAPWEDYAPERAVRGMWYRFDDTPLLDDGTLDPLAMVVLADTMPGAVSERVGPQPRTWFAPSVDLTVHLLNDCRSPWVYAHNTGRFAGDGYASADMALWDRGPEGTDEPVLVAYATQLFLFSFFD